MFSYTTHSGLLTVREAFNGFYVSNNETGETRGCGDGTQWMSGDDHKLGGAEAQQLMEDRIIDDIESAEGEWLEAYFGRK